VDEALERRRDRIVESYLDGIISRTRRDQELAEIEGKSAAAAALLKQEPAAPAPTLTREDVAALALVLAEYAFLERESKRVMLEALAPRIHVRKYEVVGVELPTHAFISEAWLQKQVLRRFSCRTSPARSQRSCRRVAAGGARAEYRNFFGDPPHPVAITKGPAVSTDRSGDQRQVRSSCMSPRIDGWMAIIFPIHEGGETHGGQGGLDSPR
jgi:hypothetical protein